MLEFGEFVLLSPKTYQSMSPCGIEVQKQHSERIRSSSPIQLISEAKQINTSVVKQEVQDKISKLTRHDLKAKRNCKLAELNQVSN